MRTLEDRIKLITLELGETFEKGFSDVSFFLKNNLKLYYQDTYDFKNIGNFYLSGFKLKEYHRLSGRGSSCLVLSKTCSVNFTIKELKENTKECYEHIKMIKY